MLSDDMVQNKIINAAFIKAEEKTWTNITIKEIADEAGVALSVVRNHFTSKKEILQAFSKTIDISVLKIIEDDTEQEDEEETAKDRLFDVIMTRLEIMAPYRKALKKILSDMKRGKGIENLSLVQLWGSNKWMLSAAGISTLGNRGRLRIVGLTSIYLQILPVWFEDEDPGLAKTMATLDKSLRDGERALGRAEAIAASGKKIIFGFSGLFKRNTKEKEPEQPAEDKRCENDSA